MLTHRLKVAAKLGGVVGDAEVAEDLLVSAGFRGLLLNSSSLLLIVAWDWNWRWRASTRSGDPHRMRFNLRVRQKGIVIPYDGDRRDVADMIYDAVNHFVWTPRALPSIE